MRAQQFLSARVVLTIYETCVSFQATIEAVGGIEWSFGS